MVPRAFCHRSAISTTDPGARYLKDHRHSGGRWAASSLRAACSRNRSPLRIDSRCALVSKSVACLVSEPGSIQACRPPMTTSSEHQHRRRSHLKSSAQHISRPTSALMQFANRELGDLSLVTSLMLLCYKRTFCDSGLMHSCKSNHFYYL
jgi:hypothetical protein